MVSVVVLFGSLCGVAALVWRAADLWADERGRLSVLSTGSLTGGIDALIQYRPRRTRVGLSAKVTLIEPTTAHLLCGVRQERGDRYGAYVIDEPDQTRKGR